MQKISDLILYSNIKIKIDSIVKTSYNRNNNSNTQSQKIIIINLHQSKYRQQRAI